MIPAAAVYLPPFLERLRQYDEPVIFTGEGINSYADALVAALRSGLPVSGTVAG